MAFEAVIIAFLSFLVGCFVGFLSACYIIHRRYDLEDDDLGYLEKIMNDEKVIKNEVCS